MQITQFYDAIPVSILFISIILVMIGFIELGFRVGRKGHAVAKKVQLSQVRSIMGAGLGLLAFMLAFTFGTAQSHFETRTQNLAEEARIARDTFLRADLLAEPASSQAKHLLSDYVKLRSGLQSLARQGGMARVSESVSRSQDIQRKLWALALANDHQSAESSDNSRSMGVFMTSILALTDAHYARAHAAFMNRISLTIWLTLYLMVALSMMIVGYQAGLTGKRSPMATVTLALAFSAVIVLITDLDRPVMSFFSVNDQLLVNLYKDMQQNLTPEYYPGD